MRRVAWILSAALVLGGCARNGPNVTQRPIPEVLQAHTPGLMAIPGVVGTAQGETGGTPAILVLVSHRNAEIDARVPRELEGYPVEVRVVGEVRKLK